MRETAYLAPREDKEGEVNEQTEVSVITSLNHFTPTVQEMLDNLGSHKVVRIGGAGNKMTKVALGVADAYCYPTRGMCYWDVCPGEVLVKGMGGLVTDFNQKRYNY